jgi:hypothetical protein
LEKWRRDGGVSRSVPGAFGSALSLFLLAGRTGSAHALAVPAITREDAPFIAGRRA